MKTPKSDDTEIEKVIKEFEYKTDAGNFPTGDYHSKEGEHLLDSEWYPESEYEIRREKVIEWLKSRLQTFAATIREEMKVRMGIDKAFQAVNMNMTWEEGRKQGHEDVFDAIRSLLAPQQLK